MDSSSEMDNSTNSSEQTTVTDITTVPIFSVTQQMTLALISICIGLLSIYGSVSIIYRILMIDKRRKSLRGIVNRQDSDEMMMIDRNTARYEQRRVSKRNNFGRKKNHLTFIYHRIMLGFAILDIIKSLSSIFSTFPVPVGTVGVWQAHGTTVTCAVQGFFMQAGVGTVLYSASLAIFFLLSIIPNVQIDTINHRIEPMLHAVPVFYAICTATAGLFLESYNPLPLGVGCWIAMYPWGCSDEGSTIECERGRNVDQLIWMFGGIPLILTFSIIIVCMIGIYFSVRNQIRKMEMRYGGGNASLSESFEDIVAMTSRRSIGGGGTRSKSSTSRMQQTKTQAQLYISIFLLVHIWPCITRLMERNNNFNVPFCLAVFVQVFHNSQGFLYYLIFGRPQFIMTCINRLKVRFGVPRNEHGRKLSVVNTRVSTINRDSNERDEIPLSKLLNGSVDETNIADFNTTGNKITSTELRESLSVEHVNKEEDTVNVDNNVVQIVDAGIQNCDAEHQQMMLVKRSNLFDSWPSESSEVIELYPTESES